MAEDYELVAVPAGDAERRDWDAVRAAAIEAAEAAGCSPDTAEALTDAVLAVLDGIKPASSLVHDLDCAQRPSWHKRRCSRCSPLAFATPPNPAARDYHRRQKARKRRSR